MGFSFLGEEISERELNERRWLRYLYYTKENRVNLERVEQVAELERGNLVLRYAERTLRLLDEHPELTERERFYVRTALEWAEVAKCGMPEERHSWYAQGLDLLIHNEASAEIFLMNTAGEQASLGDGATKNSAEGAYTSETALSAEDREIISVLIRTHGLLGQYIRGENCFELQRPLAELCMPDSSGHLRLSGERLKHMLTALNHAVIAAVDPALWEKTRTEICRLIDRICAGDLCEELTLTERLQRLFPAFRAADALTETEQKVFGSVFSTQDIWYAESALDTFSREEIATVFGIVSASKAAAHLSFYRLAKTLTYDYEGRRKINVYKKRIFERCLESLSGYSEEELSALCAERAAGADETVSFPEKTGDSAGFVSCRRVIECGEMSDHVKLVLEQVGSTLYFDIVFTPVCESLVSFCVEAERSDIMAYEKSIPVIFDLFGFRRDIFDRLNNEEQYLETMNDAAESTKLEILKHVTGDRIVDVGSGGGVLLDELEKTYPEKTVIGTDISANVIETLNRKIESEGHHYTVRRHNFTESPFAEPVDTVLFSSILHEVYSYTEWEGRRFRIGSVETALRNAADSLTPGGRIVIRDGIMADSDRIGRVRFKEADGGTFVRNYMRDFKGLTGLRTGVQDSSGGAEDRPFDENLVSLSGDVLTADVNFLREALYTYTWGVGSYALEVQEQFGYFTLKEYIAFLQKIGLKVIVARAFTEPGYPQNLDPKVELLDGLTWEELPSTCIIVAEKP